MTLSPNGQLFFTSWIVRTNLQLNFNISANFQRSTTFHFDTIASEGDLIVHFPPFCWDHLEPKLPDYWKYIRPVKVAIFWRQLYQENRIHQHRVGGKTQALDMAWPCSTNERDAASPWGFELGFPGGKEADLLGLGGGQWKKRWKKRAKPGMSCGGLNKIGLVGRTLLAPYVH